ncbi:MAG: non-hydrolyzing UDP-N-acetylglucosamine 2-epimerase [Enterococcus italicus]
MKKKVMLIFGTRPEAIKMAPIIKVLEEDERFEAQVVVTAQHREMLDQVLSLFHIRPYKDLNVMVANQTLAGLTSRVLAQLDAIFLEETPDILLVHGDTTTTFTAALAAFYHQIPIGHVEAGLRTWEKYAPFPEEMNRQMTDDLADLYFVPTEESKQNLLVENHPVETILVTGNTAIDALSYTIQETFTHPTLANPATKKILVTMHRRENLGEPMREVFAALNALVQAHPDIEVIFPMHKNPKVRAIAEEQFDESSRIHLIEPLDVVAFHNLAKHCYLILTDSGGVQEEAPSLGVPVLVLRETTERPEGVKAGTLKVIGTKQSHVYAEVERLLEDTSEHSRMAQAPNPYGDGLASERIVESLAHYFGLRAQNLSEFSYQNYLDKEVTSDET